MCRVWYKGQQLICNVCATPGHRSFDCLNKNKCHLCRAEGHFACSCPNPWGHDSQEASAGSGSQAATAAALPSGFDAASSSVAEPKSDDAGLPAEAETVDGGDSSEVPATEETIDGNVSLYNDSDLHSQGTPRLTQNCYC